MINRLFRHIYTIVAAATVALGAGSCAVDDLDFSLPGDGMAEVTLDLSFHSFISSDVASRAAAGDAISDIYDVCVVAFTTSGSHVSTRYISKADGLVVSDSDHRPADDVYEGDVVRKATVPVTLPYGQYHIYAVANMGHPDSWSETFSNEAEFRKLRFDWNDDIGLNGQMCGVVTESADKVVVNRQPDLITIGKPAVQLHSWLQRAVSKATIAYDASQLNDNVWIYIVSASVKDIPRSCSMIDHNVPQVVDQGTPNLSADQCLTQGESINYLRTAGDPTSSRVMLSRGSSYGGFNKVSELQPGNNVHRIDEESLFFFENMQGTHPNKHIYNNFESKDNVEYGTYIEVEAYYLNRNTNSASSGRIIYRYMLGMNDTDDFNAMRNTHYKVTLRFIGDANDPDWHIEYNHSDVPEVHIPSPLYVSYLYNQEIKIPINSYFDDTKYFVKSVNAEITANAYTYPGHKYHGLDVPVNIGGHTYNWSDPKYGFLSFLNLEHKTSIDVSKDENYLGTVSYTTFDGANYDKDTNNWTFSIPAYSRPLNLLVPGAGGELTYLGFSGDNNHVNQHRHAMVRVNVKFGSHTDPMYESSIVTDVEVVQVNRIVNPRGIWRPADSTDKFTVVIMNSTGDPTNVTSIAESAVDFTPLGSYGPWTARVYTESYQGANIRPGVDWIELSPEGKNQWRGGPDATVTGATNTQVRFDFRPASKLSPGEEPRFGVIEVMYHDNKCRHLILVSQGYGAVNVGDEDWMMGNLFANGTEVENPLMEGSMFKYGNTNYALRARNNFNLDPGGQDRDPGPYKDASNATIWWADREYSGGKFAAEVNEAINVKYGTVKADLANGFSGPGLTYKAKSDGTLESGTYRMAGYDDFNKLLDADRFGMMYGIMYGSEVQTTISHMPDRYTTAGDCSGMRGCFVYDRSNGNHIFLPIGATGNGRRKVYYESPTGMRHAALKYSEVDAELPYSDAIKAPILYDVYRKAGGIYWYDRYREVDGKTRYAFDVNYYTLQAKHNETQMLFYYNDTGSSALTKFRNTKYGRPSSDWADQNSDAAYVRRIRVSK